MVTARVPPEILLIHNFGGDTFAGRRLTLAMLAFFAVFRALISDFFWIAIFPPPDPSVQLCLRLPECAILSNRRAKKLGPRDVFWIAPKKPMSYSLESRFLEVAGSAEESTERLKINPRSV